MLGLSLVVSIIRKRNNRQKDRESNGLNKVKNTIFFHVKASHHHRKNRIEGLCNEASMWISDEKSLCNVMRNYFETLFTSDCNGMFEEIHENISRCVTIEMNAILDSLVEDKEIMGTFK